MDLSLMEQFANPDLFTDLSFGDKMVGALITMVMGMGITFVVLIILWGIIASMAKIFNKQDAKKDESAVSDPPGTGSSVKVVEEKSGELINDSELIAVITAAAMAYEDSGTIQSDLIVRKINRTTGRSTAWSRAGAQATIDSRNI